MDVTKPYEFIGFGAMDVTKHYEFIGYLGGSLHTRGGDYTRVYRVHTAIVSRERPGPSK